MSGASTVTGAEHDVGGASNTVGVTYAASTMLSPAIRRSLLPQRGRRLRGTARRRSWAVALSQLAAKVPAVPQQTCSLTRTRRRGVAALDRRTGQATI